MFTITISTADGRSVTSDDAKTLMNRIQSWNGAKPMRTADRDRLYFLGQALREERIKDAGDIAGTLGLNFAFAPARQQDAYERITEAELNDPTRDFMIDEFSVPVDPADATQCDACQ